jgi:hypothetical protein
LFFLKIKENKEIVTNIKADATTIDGPDGVSRCKELNIPIITASTARPDEIIAISSGELANCLAEAAGIISNDVIKSKPTILKDTATTTVIINIINN